MEPWNPKLTVCCSPPPRSVVVRGPRKHPSGGDGRRSRQGSSRSLRGPFGTSPSPGWTRRRPQSWPLATVGQRVEEFEGNVALTGAKYCLATAEWHQRADLRQLDIGPGDERPVSRTLSLR